jgi:hypothetical protein
MFTMSQILIARLDTGKQKGVATDRNQSEAACHDLARSYAAGAVARSREPWASIAILGVQSLLSASSNRVVPGTPSAIPTSASEGAKLVDTVLESRPPPCALDLLVDTAPETTSKSRVDKSLIHHPCLVET